MKQVLRKVVVSVGVVVRRTKLQCNDDETIPLFSRLLLRPWRADVSSVEPIFGYYEPIGSVRRKRSSTSARRCWFATATRRGP